MQAVSLDSETPCHQKLRPLQNTAQGPKPGPRLVSNQRADGQPVKCAVDGLKNLQLQVLGGALPMSGWSLTFRVEFVR